MSRDRELAALAKYPWEPSGPTIWRRVEHGHRVNANLRPQYHPGRGGGLPRAPVEEETLEHWATLLRDSESLISSVRKGFVDAVTEANAMGRAEEIAAVLRPFCPLSADARRCWACPACWRTWGKQKCRAPPSVGRGPLAEQADGPMPAVPDDASLGHSPETTPFGLCLLSDIKAPCPHQ